MHVKSDNLESFWFKRKELVVQKNHSEVEKNEFKKKEEIKKTKRIKQKRKWKKDEKFDERKPQKRSKIDKNYTWNVIVRKNAFLEWKRIEKTKKSFQKKKLYFVRFLLVRKFCEGEQWNTRFLLHLCQKNGVSKFVLLLKKFTKMRTQRRDFKRAQTKRYTKRRNCIPTSFRKGYVLEKMLQKKRK